MNQSLACVQTLTPASFYTWDVSAFANFRRDLAFILGGGILARPQMHNMYKKRIYSSINKMYIYF